MKLMTSRSPLVSNHLIFIVKQKKVRLKSHLIGVMIYVKLWSSNAQIHILKTTLNSSNLVLNFRLMVSEARIHREES